MRGPGWIKLVTDIEQGTRVNNETLELGLCTKIQELDNGIPTWNMSR